MQSDTHLRILTFLRQFVVRPQLITEDETRIAGVLHNALTVLILLGLLSLFVLPISDTPLLTTSILVSLIVSCLAGQYLLHRGNIRGAATLFCTVLWIITTISSLISGGMTSPLLFSYTGVITVAGLTFSRRTTILVTALCIASSGGIIAVTLWGTLPPAILQVDWLTVFITHLLSFIWLGYIFFISKRSAAQALDQIRHKESELQRQTADLLRLNTELQKALAAMHESENRFRTAVKYLPDMFVIYDADGKLRFANARLLDVLGYTWEELQKLSLDAVLPEQVVQAYQPLLMQAMKTGEPTTAERTITFCSGKQSVLIFQYVPLHNEQDEIYETIGIVKDITRQKQTENALEEQKDLLSLRVQERTAELSRANAQLIDAMRAKDEFLATINHELRTPLTSVLLGTQMLQSEVYGTPSPEQKQFLDMIERNSHSLLTLITDILYFSKLEAGQLEPQLTTIDVPQVCQNAMDTVRNLAAQKNILLQSDIETPLGHLRADERSLKQILVNLLNNAVKFTHEGGEVGLHVVTNLAQQTISFHVWDTGIGISDADMERVFQPFVQIDSGLARQYEGSGLGLALIRRLTDLHGGSISLSSRVGSGSKFTVSLPLSPAGKNNGNQVDIIRRTRSPEQTDGLQDGRTAPAAVTLDTHSTSETSSAADTPTTTDTAPGYKVLIAEDTEHTLKTLTIFFQYHGCQVVMARNGLEAVERVFEEMPDVILIDIQMPVMDGLEAIQRIRQHPRGRDIPIVALTALTMPGDREKCLQAGADLYVPKPVNMHELLGMIQKILLRAPHKQ